LIYISGWINWISYFGDFPLFGSIVTISSRISVTLGMIFLVYIPVLIGFGLFFNLCGLSAFSSFTSIILKELGEVTGGDLGVAQIYKGKYGIMGRY
jgi:hypothetical protein